MNKVLEFKELLIKLIESGNTNCGRNQVIDKINTAFETYKIMENK